MGCMGTYSGDYGNRGEGGELTLPGAIGRLCLLLSPHALGKVMAGCGEGWREGQEENNKGRSDWRLLFTYPTVRGLMSKPRILLLKFVTPPPKSI